MPLPGFPEPGALVRFQPPDNAYSPESQQSLVAGQTGTIFQVWNDSFVLAWFGQDLLTINTAYLELCAAPKKSLKR